MYVFSQHWVASYQTCKPPPSGYYLSSIGMKSKLVEPSPLTEQGFYCHQVSSALSRCALHRGKPGTWRSVAFSVWGSWPQVVRLLYSFGHRVMLICILECLTSQPFWWWPRPKAELSNTTRVHLDQCPIWLKGSWKPRQRGSLWDFQPHFQSSFHGFINTSYTLCGQCSKRNCG